MPIRRENKALYPKAKQWKAIRVAILERAGHACEGCILYPQCRARNYYPHPVTGSRVVLTIAHWPDPDPRLCHPGNLRALCQRCHLALDREAHRRTRRRNRVVRGHPALPL